MTKEEFADILLPITMGFAERQFLPDLEPATYEKWNAELQRLFVACGEFAEASLTTNRISALIRAIGRYEYWKGRGIPEYVAGTIDEAIPVILAMAKDFEANQYFTKDPLFRGRS